MEQEEKQTTKPPWGVKEWKDCLWSVLFIIGILALGFFAVNQVLEYRYKAVFLGSPCELCAKVNPDQGTCIKDCFTYKKQNEPYLNLNLDNSTVNINFSEELS